MPKIAILTDSNSCMTQLEAAELRQAGSDIFVLPMPVIINGELHFEDIDMTQERFYQLLAENASVSTSQPSVGEVADMWDKLLADYDELLYIPMSSGLSHSFATAETLAQEYGNRVAVANNHRISVTLYRSVIQADYLAKQGMTAMQIKQHLEATRYDSSIYIMCDTLKYLVAGGRLTPAAGALASIFRIKPVLQIQGEKLDAFAKCLGVGQARKAMLKAVQKDLEDRFGCAVSDMHIDIAYTANTQLASDWQREVTDFFGDIDPLVRPLSLSISCHIGPNSLAIAATMKGKK